MIYEKLNNIVENKTGIFQEAIIPGDCPTFDEETAIIRGYFVFKKRGKWQTNTVFIDHVFR